MKKLYVLALIVTASFASNAQNFTYSTDQHYDEVMVGSFNNYDISFTTPTPMDVTFGWELISNTMPVEWDFSLCDYQACYVGVPVSGTMTAITELEATNGTEGFLKLTAGHAGVNGEGTITMYVFDENAPANGDTVSWHLVYGSASINELANASVKVYPNPASDVVNIEGEGFTSVAVFNALGEQVISLVGDLTTSIDVSNLEGGVYMLALENETGGIITKRLIVK